MAERLNEGDKEGAKTDAAEAVRSSPRERVLDRRAPERRCLVWDEPPSSNDPGDGHMDGVLDDLVSPVVRHEEEKNNSRSDSIQSAAGSHAPPDGPTERYC